MKRTYLTHWTLCAIAALFLVPAAHSNADEQAAQLPKWLKKELKRETRRRGKTRTVSMLDGALVAEVKSRSDIEPQSADWGTYFTIDIGTPDAEMECYVFEKPNESAKLLDYFGQVIVDSALEANNAELNTKEMTDLTIDHVGPYPYMAAEWLFLIKLEDGEVLVAQAKAAVALFDRTSLACNHSQVGYSQTFRKAFLELLSPIKHKTDGLETYYSEIFFTEIQDRRVGFVQTRFAVDADGDHYAAATDATAFPVSSSTLATSDNFTAEWIRTDGSLINAYTLSVENGEVAKRLQFNPADEGGWTIAGEIQGKEYSASLDNTAPVQSTLTQIQTIREVMRDDSRQDGALVAWIPDADPGALTDVTFTQNDQQLSGTLSLGPLTMPVQLTEDAMLKRMDIEVSGVTVQMLRAWSEGSVPELEP